MLEIYVACKAMIPRMKVFLVTALTCIAVNSLLITDVVVAAPSGYPGMKRCGSFPARYRIWVFASHVGCAGARRIQREFWLAPKRVVWHCGTDCSDSKSWMTLTRFPGWKCKQGAGGGRCFKGRMIAAYAN